MTKIQFEGTTVVPVNSLAERLGGIKAARSMSARAHRGNVTQLGIHRDPKTGTAHIGYSGAPYEASSKMNPELNPANFAYLGALITRNGWMLAVADPDFAGSRNSIGVLTDFARFAFKVGQPQLQDFYGAMPEGVNTVVMMGSSVGGLKVVEINGKKMKDGVLLPFAKAAILTGEDGKLYLHGTNGKDIWKALEVTGVPGGNKLSMITSFARLEIDASGQITLIGNTAQNHQRIRLDVTEVTLDKPTAKFLGYQETKQAGRYLGAVSGQEHVDAFVADGTIVTTPSARRWPTASAQHASA